MGLEFTLDLEGIDEDRMERGDVVPPDWYHLRLDDVYDDEKNPGMVVFQYAVLEGPYTNWKIFDRLGDPDGAEDEGKAAVIAKRRNLLASRLGLLTEDEKVGKGANGTRKTWLDCLGREVVGKVEERKFTRKDGTEGTATGLSFGDIFPLDYKKKLPKAFPASMLHLMSQAAHPEPAETATKTATAKPTAKTEAPAKANAKPAMDFSDL